MSEVITSPIAATHLEKDAFHDRRLAGSFMIGEVDSDGETSFWYCCPCGCGRFGLLTVGKGFKPSDGPSWSWNGSLDRPTLHPSVHHVGHWHGWLQDGVWKSC